eukprot:jgi/Chlat1/975/Chrsp108S01395
MLRVLPATSPGLSLRSLRAVALSRGRRWAVSSSLSSSATAAMAAPKVKIDVVSDTICPWCFVGKKNLEAAMDKHKDKFDFEVNWRPYMLDPSMPKECVNKWERYLAKFGPQQAEAIVARVSKAMANVGVKFSMNGETANTLDSHRLIWLAGQQGGAALQNALVEELFELYFVRETCIGDRRALVESANKVGVKGAEEFLGDEGQGTQEVLQELAHYARGVSGVPHFIIGDSSGERVSVSGAQPADVFGQVFQQLAA